MKLQANVHKYKSQDFASLVTELATVENSRRGFSLDKQNGRFVIVQSEMLLN